jgi:hypothetical protein
MTLHRFTQPIVTIDGLGEAIVLPPCDACDSVRRWVEPVVTPRGQREITTSCSECNPPAVGAEAEVVEPIIMPCDACDMGDVDPLCVTDRQAEPVTWRRVAFVRVVEVLPIVGKYGESMDLCQRNTSHIWIDGSDVIAVIMADNGANETSLALPTAEPGGLVVVVERIECPKCDGTMQVDPDDAWMEAHEPSGDGWQGARPSFPCPTCTTPPEVKT